MDSTAANYDPLATVDSLTWCVPSVTGCMDPLALSYSPSITVHDPSTCTYQRGCQDVSAINYDAHADEPGTCYFFVEGCLDPAALNYGCGAYSTTACTTSGSDSYLGGESGSQYAIAISSVGVTLHNGVICIMSVSDAASAASVADLLAIAAANPSAGTTDQIQVVVSVVVEEAACTMASRTATLADMAAAVGARGANVLNADDCRRRLQTGASTNALIGFYFVFSAAEAAQQEAALTGSGGVFESSTSLTTALTTAGVSGVPSIPQQTFTTTVSYYTPPSSDDELGAGAIVGIVIGCLVGVALIAGVAFMMMKRQTKTSEIVPA